MLYNEKIQFEAEVELLLKPILKTLYLTWKQYDAAMVHQAFTHYICKRNNAKILQLVNRRKHRRLKTQQYKTELEQLKVKQQLENYVEAL